MTSLLGRLLRLFPESVRLEDLFTEAVARLFERRPQLCVDWLRENGLLPDRADIGGPNIRVSSQKPFLPLAHHDTGSRPDLYIEVYRPPGEEPEEEEPVTDVVMVESKIGSGEGEGQLRRYAEHLDRITDTSSKTLLYITRNYDPKEPDEILSGLDGDVRFEQLRWHDFYKFLQTAEKDALTEEVMTFMEEQGMSRSHRFSTSDLMALSGVPRAFEIFDETLGDEVRAELESFAGNKTRPESADRGNIRRLGRYARQAPLHSWDLQCSVGYRMRTPDGYPAAFVSVEARPKAVGRDASVAAMKSIALREGWEGFNQDDPTKWAGVQRVVSLASLLQEEDHVAAVKRFFIESIRQLREKLTAFKKEHPDLPWNGGS